MDNGKNKNVTIITETKDARNSGFRRTWSKPTVKRIEIKQTMAGNFSRNDGLTSNRDTL